MRGVETSVAVVVLVVGAYLVASSLGVVVFQLHHLLGAALVAFGLTYMASERRKEAAFWGGVLSIVGAAVAAGGQGDPVLALGVLLIFTALFILLARYKQFIRSR
ncbi:MAG: hypothetical protein QXT46_07335 [Pyrobaculum sp.]